MAQVAITQEKARAVAQDLIGLGAKHGAALFRHILTLPPSPLIFAASISAGCIGLSYFTYHKRYDHRITDFWNTLSRENKIVSQLSNIWSWLPYSVQNYAPKGPWTKLLLGVHLGMFILNQLPSFAPVLQRHFTHVPKLLQSRSFLGIPYTLFTSTFNDQHWLDVAISAVNMYRLLPMLANNLEFVDFWAFLISSAVVSSTVSHYVHNDSLVPTFGFSGMIGAMNTFLFLRTVDSSVAAAPGILGYLYRFRHQYWNTLRKADEKEREWADFTLPDFNFTMQIAGGVWGVVMYKFYKKLHQWY